MLTVRTVSRGRVALRSALAAAEVTLTLVVAHTLAGGSLQSPAWVAVMAATVFGAGLLVLRGTVRPLLAVPALATAQVGLHLWLTVLTSAPAHHGDGGLHLTAPMLGAHLVAALVTALSWSLRSRAVEVVVAWSAAGVLPLPTVRRTAVPTRAVLPRGRRPLAVAPLRGPPVVL